MEQLQTAQFPSRFRFGVADADLQVIGEKHCLAEEQSEPSVWTHFAQTSGKVFENHTPLDGVDRYHRWKEDIALMKELGIRHYRTSVSLCRTLRRDGTVNERAIEWYRQYFRAIREAGIDVYVSIFHWELPLWLHEKGGWKNREIVDVLVRHSLIVQEQLGEFINEFFILNEPFQFTLLSYHLGEHAPGETDLAGGLMAVHHAMLAQGSVFHALKKRDPNAKIGTVYNSRVFYALTSSEDDLRATRLAQDYQTRMFLEPLYRGQYPEELRAHLQDVWPSFSEEDMAIMRVGDGLHSFGLNYYRGMTIRADASSQLGFREVQFPQGVKNGLGWPVYVGPIYPDGLYDLLRGLHNRYESLGMRRIYISESGTCWDDRIGADGIVHDEFRTYFFREHFQQLLKAILAGVPVEAFFAWTLLDNYEWDMGFKPGSNFGIVHVDRKTLQRTPKESFHWYKELIRHQSSSL